MPEKSHLQGLGERVEAARLKRGWTVEKASREADISRTTWGRVEDGLGVQDVKRAAVLNALGLDHNGDPVGGPTQDAGYVSSPGAIAERTESDSDVLRRLDAMEEALRELREAVVGKGDA